MDVSAIATASGTPAAAATDATVQASSVQATAPQAQPVQDNSSNGQPAHGPALAPIVSKIFGSPSNQQSIPLNVSYRVLDVNLGEIVTVFTDPTTGQEVAQFPPEIVVGIAQFFDQQSGATLDKTA
jgi:uncharacterized FlaG/YvyC family protein